MEVIRARNVNGAYYKGVALLKAIGVPQKSRAGEVLVAPCPVTTVYDKPMERVLFDPGRDANPFFHLFESLWMLAGRNDATWLDQFVKDFSSRFAEDDGFQHGAYGFRWRRHFDVEGGGRLGLPDQLDTVVKLLQDNPDDRRVVLQMWDPVADLGAQKRDLPCNTQAYLRVRTENRTWIDEGAAMSGLLETEQRSVKVLDLTVCCRSNDIIWGCYGANAVHFSVLQEYLATRIGVEVGQYYQVSNNWHGYKDVLDKVGIPVLFNPYAPTDPVSNKTSAQCMITVPEEFDADLRKFMSWSVHSEVCTVPYANQWFFNTAEPLFTAAAAWRAKRYEDAWATVNCCVNMAPDWKLAVQQWMQRRLDRMNKPKTGSKTGGEIACK